jgi:hypothetical protein
VSVILNSQNRFYLFKKICFLTIFSFFLLTGCGKSQVTTEESLLNEAKTTSQPTPIPSTTPTKPDPTPTVPPPTQTPVPQPTVDSNLFNVEITFPASFFKDQDMSTFDVDEYTQKNKFKKTVINEDGSITATMSKSRHQELVDETVSTITKSFNEMIGSKDYPYITGITPNDDYSLVIVDVDRIKYNSAFFDMSPLMIYIQTYFYQLLNGMEYHTEVIIRDNLSKEEIHSIIYPDALEQSTNN